MTWTSTICVVVMAKYGRTLCWKKRNTVPNTGGCLLSGQRNATPNTGGVFSVGQYSRPWTLPTRSDYGVRPWVWSERAPGHPVRPLSRRLLSIVVLVRCLSVRDAGSYIWPERVLLLDSVTTVVPIGNSRSTSSRGGVVSAFARGFNVFATGGGCTDFIVHGKH